MTPAPPALSGTTRRLTRRTLIRVLTLCTVWAVVFALVYLVAPVQPRFTIPLDPADSIVGITPDSQELVALTMRRMPRKGIGFKSGPLGLWNLRTGTKRTVCLPYQDCSGAPELSLDPPMMADPEGWQAEVQPNPVRGRWMQMQFDSDGRERDYRLPPSNLIVNLDTDDFLQATFNESVHAGVALSPTGRWSVEAQAATDFDFAGPIQTRVIETATGKTQFELASPNFGPKWAFSKDDRLFACSLKTTRARNSRSTLQVWQTDPPQRLYEVENSDSIPAFSDDGALLAVRIDDGSRADLVVFDSRSGLRVFEHRLEQKIPWDALMQELRFSADGHWLFYSDEVRHRFTSGLNADHPDMTNVSAVDLRTNERRVLGDEIDPRLCEVGGELTELPPFTLDANHQLAEFPTGRALATLPNDLDTVAVTRDGRTLLVEQWIFSGNSLLQRSLMFIEWLDVPLPQAFIDWASASRLEWQVVDVPSLRVRVRMPAEQRVQWLSPDEQTFVTQPLDGSLVINIWDFPPRKPFWSAAMWALTAPGVIAFWWWIRRKPLNPPTIVA